MHFFSDLKPECAFTVRTHSFTFTCIFMHYWNFCTPCILVHSCAFLCIRRVRRMRVGAGEHMTHSDAFWCIHIFCILDIGIPLHYNAFWCILQISRIPVHSCTLFPFACIQMHSVHSSTSAFLQHSCTFWAFTSAAFECIHVHSLAFILHVFCTHSVLHAFWRIYTHCAVFYMHFKCIVHRMHYWRIRCILHAF